MATHTVSISDSLGIFGGGLTSRWNAFNWGEANWGQNFPLEFLVGKLISNAQAESVGFVKSVFHIIENTESASSTVLKFPQHIFGNTLSPSATVASAVRSLGDWDYLFPGEQEDSIGRVETSYTQVTAATTTYTTFTTASVTWSEA